MIHCIYVKNSPKKHWHLAFITVSAETAVKNMQEALTKAKNNGYEKAEVGLQVQESSEHVPEIVKKIKNAAPMFN